VVLLWNLDVQGGLANGTRGVVEGLVSVSDYLQQVRHEAAANLHGGRLCAVGLCCLAVAAHTGRGGKLGQRQ
jgi:hypothetical protein